ncbi:MAG: glycerol-3-phosphate acyltransferase [Gammaproteobacteria bacterium]|nr:glycerol-3-phosphate acyltransferase [Gammaproteobacteria bacterium]
MGGAGLLELGLKTLIAYLLGSLMGALLIGAARGVDIRESGSGNAGGTNALRTQGFWFAAAVVVIDIGKGVVAAGWLPEFSIPGIARDSGIDRDWLAMSCAAAVVAGHIWPLYHEFRGGKGGATFIGTLLVLAPAVVPVAIAGWFLIVLLTGFVGLATMIAAATVPMALWFFGRQSPPLFAFAVAMAVFIVWAHRSNIGRMKCGIEPHLTGLWLLRPRTGK